MSLLFSHLVCRFSVFAASPSRLRQGRASSAPGSLQSRRGRGRGLWEPVRPPERRTSRRPFSHCSIGTSAMVNPLLHLRPLSIQMNSVRHCTEFPRPFGAAMTQLAGNPREMKSLFQSQRAAFRAQRRWCLLRRGGRIAHPSMRSSDMVLR